MNIMICILKVIQYFCLIFSKTSEKGVAWKAALKKTELKLELLTDIDILLMVEEGVRVGICHAIHWYAKANNKYIKDYDKNKKLSYPKYCYINNLYGWAMLQKLPVNNFEWIEDTSQFNEDFVKNYNENSNEGISWIYLIMICNSYLKEWKLNKLKSLLLIYMIKMCYSHKKFKASIQSWINLDKKQWLNLIKMVG